MAGFFEKPGVCTRFAGCLAVLCLAAPALLAQGYTIKTVAGDSTNAYAGDGGAATAAQFSTPLAIAVDGSGNIYIADLFNQRVRKVGADGNINTFAGNGTAGETGDGGAATSAEIYHPGGVAVDSSGNVYFADITTNVVRKVTSSGTISTFAGVYGNSGFTGDGGKASAAYLNHANGVAVDAAGNVYIADTENQRIRKVAADGTITTFAGNGSAGYSGDGGAAINARLNGPRGVAVDNAGNVYVGDTLNSRVRKIAADGTISTVAGSGARGFCGDFGAATSACLNYPWGVTTDSSGNLYIADYSNSRIRKVSPNGLIATVAGNGRFRFTGDGGQATSASLYFPADVAVDGSGNVYIADSQNNVVRMLAPPAGDPRPVISQNGVISQSAFGGFPSAAPGSWIEIHGTYLAAGTRAWKNSDFNGPNAPTTLLGTTVAIGGENAVLSYVSANQINAQVPSDLAPGALQVTVTTMFGTSDPHTLAVNRTQPGLMAPDTFNVNGTQYAAALLSDGAAYAAPQNAIPNVPTRPVRPGEVITLHGIGFGPVTPAVPTGQTTQQSNALDGDLKISIGGVPATVTYAGLEVGSVGIYRIDVVVPNAVAGDAVPLTFTLNGTSGAQSLVVAVTQ